jgi:glycosyltransferase 2 family protein
VTGPGLGSGESGRDLRPAPADAGPASIDAAGAEGAGEAVRSEDVSADQLSLARRLRQPRTLFSILFPIAIIALILLNARGFKLDQLGQTLLRANLPLVVAAFVAYYIGFPLRGYRWRVILQSAGTRIGLGDSTEILFISWLVNCLVPAKLGDVYRAYLLRLNFDVSLSRTFGTVFIERIFDLFAIAILGLGAGYWSFRTGLPPYVQFVFAIGIAVIVVLALGLFTLRNFGRRLMTRMKLPHRAIDLYDRFEQGVFAINPWQVPWLGFLTAVIWGTECVRLFLVIESLGFTDVHLGISGTVFVALAASLLTAIPLTPAGLGVVEAGIVGILTLVYGVSPTDAAAIALVDRAISVLSVIVIGLVVYVLSGKTKGGRAQPAATTG